MDVMITATSRKEPLKRTVESFLERMVLHEPINFLLHEDVVDEESSRDMIDWAYNSQYFKIILVTNPRAGRSQAFMNLKKFVSSEILFYTEDDWEFLHVINLNYLISVMKKYSQINQICFNRLPNPTTVQKPSQNDPQKVFRYFMRIFDSEAFLISERWNWLPGLWRKDFIWPYLNFQKGQVANRTVNRALKAECKENPEMELEWNHEFLARKIGAYLYGRVGDGPFVRHLGDETRNERGFL